MKISASIMYSGAERWVSQLSLTTNAHKMTLVRAYGPIFYLFFECRVFFHIKIKDRVSNIYINLSKIRIEAEIIRYNGSSEAHARSCALGSFRISLDLILEHYPSSNF